MPATTRNDVLELCAAAGRHHRHYMTGIAHADGQDPNGYGAVQSHLGALP